MRRAGTGLALMAALAVAAAPVEAGPPWISIEFPTNPHHVSTRDAAFLVHVYHHLTAIDAKVSGRLVSSRDGRRTSVPLTVEATTLPGVYAVRGLPEAGREQVAIITMENGSATASAVVSIDARGDVAAVEVPSDRTPDGWIVPRPVNDIDIANGLRLSAAASAATDELAGGPAGAALPALLLIPIGLAFALRAGSAGDRRND